MPSRPKGIARNEEGKIWERKYMAVACIFSAACSSGNPVSEVTQNLMKSTERDIGEEQNCGMPFTQIAEQNRINL